MTSLNTTRLVILGAGTIAKQIMPGLLEMQPRLGFQILGSFSRGKQSLHPSVPVLESGEDCLSLAPHLLIELAGVEAFVQYVPAAISAGIDVLAVSAAALARPDIEKKLLAPTDTSLGLPRGRLLLASGAVGGLDALSAAKEGGLTRVTVIQRKPPQALLNQEQANELRQAKLIQEASAREVALALPQNSNVAAAVALAGLGLDKTRVQVIADPAVTRNTVEVLAEGAFGHLHLTMQNLPSPDNPKSSVTPAMSVLAAVRRYMGAMSLPA
jgi:aspartate dehydrogenase